MAGRLLGGRPSRGVPPGRPGRGGAALGTALRAVAAPPLARPTLPRIAPLREAEPLEDGAALADRHTLVPVAVLATVAVGLLLRLTAAEDLSSQIDEPASVLAAQMVAEKGLPVLPSGTLYLHGATLSYLLAPLVWLGRGDLGDLYHLRLVSAAFGAAAVYLAYRLGRAVTGEPWAGVLAAALLALDPASVQWSGHVRMYAVLQALTLGLVWLSLRVLGGPPSRRLLLALVGLFWLATLTHVGAALLWPPLVLAAVLIHRRDLLGRRRDLALALLACPAAPLALTLAGRFSQPENLERAEEAPLVSFAGGRLVEVGQLLKPNIAAWRTLFEVGALSHLMTTLVALACGLLAGRYLLGRSAAPPARRRAVGVLFAFYWVPILIITVLTDELQARYLLNVHPIGLLLLVVAAQDLVADRAAGQAPNAAEPAGRWGALARWWDAWFPTRLAGVALVLLTVLHLASGVWSRLANPTVDPDYDRAMAYVAASHQPGEPVIASLPTAAYLTLGGAADVRFLAGQAGRERTLRYTRLTADGEYLDYWVGAESLVSTRALCDALRTNPTGTWLVVDTERLDATWAYGGAMAQVIYGTTREVHRVSGERDGRPRDAIVFRLVPQDDWTAEARRGCSAGGKASPAP